jgi:hypothetical protein
MNSNRVSAAILLSVFFMAMTQPVFSQTQEPTSNTKMMKEGKIVTPPIAHTNEGSVTISCPKGKQPKVIEKRDSNGNTAEAHVTCV